MSDFTTKFQVSDICYTFDDDNGIIYRHIVEKVLTGDTGFEDIIKYRLYRSSPDIIPALRTRHRLPDILESKVYTEMEVKQLAQSWLLTKSTNEFMDATVIPTENPWTGPSSTPFTF